MFNKISVIIPTYNEEGILLELVTKLATLHKDIEIIVADGGSTDRTLEYILDFAIVIDSELGRAVQMNAGAKVAKGDILWFLHADCEPSYKSIGLIKEAFKDDKLVGGGFRWALRGDMWYYKYITGMAHIKNKLRRNLFGDMGIFVAKDAFRELKGYKEIPFLEDMEFNRRLKKLGKTVIFNEPLYSSDRRLLKKGPMFSFFKNLIIKIAFHLGFSPFWLANFYYKKEK